MTELVRKHPELTILRGGKIGERLDAVVHKRRWKRPLVRPDHVLALHGVSLRFRASTCVDQKQAVHKTVAIVIEWRQRLGLAIFLKNFPQKSRRIIWKTAACSALAVGVEAIGIRGPDPFRNFPGHG